MENKELFIIPMVESEEDMANIVRVLTENNYETLVTPVHVTQEEFNSNRGYGRRYGYRPNTLKGYSIKIVSIIPTPEYKD